MGPLHYMAPILPQKPGQDHLYPTHAKFSRLNFYLDTNSPPKISGPYIRGYGVSCWVYCPELIILLFFNSRTARSTIIIILRRRRHRTCCRSSPAFRQSLISKIHFSPSQSHPRIPENIRLSRTTMRRRHRRQIGRRNALWLRGQWKEDRPL